MRAAAVDARVVSHLPNVRYLTGFVGTAGLVVLTPAQCVLVVDFRYQTVARSLVQSTPDLADYVTVVVPAKSYDETLADVLRQTGARRIGMIVSRGSGPWRKSVMMPAWGCRGPAGPRRTSAGEEQPVPWTTASHPAWQRVGLP